MSTLDDYVTALSREDQMRAQMYQPGMESDLMNTDPYYHLLHLPWRYEEFQVREKQIRSDLLFSNSRLTPQSKEKIFESLQELQPFFAIPDLLIAGGRIFSALFGAKFSDIDIFIWGCSSEKAEKKIVQIGELLKMLAPPSSDKVKTSIKMTRTRNAVSFRVQAFCEINNKMRILSTQDYQIILRLYRSPSEILHGFDVDSCCLGYDGNEIWATERAYFALNHGYNMVNFNRLSPSYEFRLIKYATRGMAICVPDFDRSRIDLKGVETSFENDLGKELKGLDLLIYADALWSAYGRLPVLSRHLLGSIKEKSDYNLPFFSGGADIASVLEYLLETAYNYNRASRKYLQYLAEGIHNLDEAIEYLMDSAANKARSLQIAKRLEQYSKFVIPSIPTVKRISFIGLTCPLEEFEPKNSTHLLRIDENLYRGLEIVSKWDFPAQVIFKTIRPGEQMSNTFHQTVLQDKKVWYNGRFYTL